MKKVIINFYILISFLIVLCCGICIYKNLHNGHKVLEISDEESLKKENITIEASSKEFNINIQKIIELKNKLENEINEINKLYEKAIDDLTKSFLKKHEILLKQENDIKEKLQNEVTKTKEKLENYCSQLNNEILINERINKGIKKFENEDKNINKILSYISKINKNQKQINILLQEQMKNIKFNYKEEESNIKYEEYYFNGISIPKDIEFKDISSNSINISWKIENINNINIDNNKIKYRVEKRKEKEEFIKVYEGNNQYCSINNLEFNTNYEFRICSIYNDIIGSWSEIYKIKTFDSIILKDNERKNEFIKKMLEWSGYKRMDLIYRGSRDGMTSNNFHNKCDNQGPTIVLLKNEKSVFGGFTSVSWSTDNKYLSSPDCFIFTLINIHNTESTKFPYKNDSYAVCHYSNYGPCFGGGHDIGITQSDYLNNKIYTNFPYSYQDVLGKGNSIFTGDFNNSNQSLYLKEIEVFKLFK